MNNDERKSALRVSQDHEGIWLSLWAEGLGSRSVCLTPEEARILSDQLSQCARPHNSTRKVRDDPQA